MFEFNTKHQENSIVVRERERRGEESEREVGLFWLKLLKEKMNRTFL